MKAVIVLATIVVLKIDAGVVVFSGNSVPQRSEDVSFSIFL